MIKNHLALLVAMAFMAAPATGQSVTELLGIWRADTPDGPADIIVRADSSASLGDETVRWRTVGDSLHLAIGDEWIVYGFNIRRGRMTLSGGDLEEPIDLRRIGPPTPLPDGVAVPPAPPADRRAWIGTEFGLASQ